MAKTVNIGEVRKEKIKPALMDLFWAMTHVVDNWQTGGHPDDQLSSRWIMVEVSRGKRIPHILTESGTLREMELSVLAQQIADYIKRLDPLAAQRRWNLKTQIECAKFVVTASSSKVGIESIARIAWRDEPVWTFARMPFNRSTVLDDPFGVLKGACPVFSEFLERFESPTQARAYCAWIGSVVLDRENKTHRGVILYGEGRNGKSAQLRMFDSVFGDSIVYKNCGSSNEFKSEGLEHTRMMVYADANDRNLFSDAMTKSIIGGDKLEMNMKGIRQFTISPKVKVIACTNKLPNIRDNIAEKRRWIFCSISGFNGEDNPTYQETLDAESEWIIGCCCDIYEQTRRGNDIAVDESALDEVTSTADADVEYFCEQHFIREETGKVRGCNIAALLAAKGSRLGKDRVIAYLKKHYGAIKTTFREDFTKDTVVCGWGGISLRPASRQLINFQDHADVM